jgi:hypothetical protein
MIDIVPTILEATGIKAPEFVNGIKQKPIEGVSMAYTFDKANATAPSPHKIQYFEMASNRGIYNDGWYANTTLPIPPWELKAPTVPINEYKWELYNLKEDYSQFNDLSAKMPDKLKEMQALLAQEAEKYGVFPLDNQAFARAITPRPSTTAGKTFFIYTGVNVGIPTGNAPNILNRSFTITAEVDVPQSGANGMIVTEGGRWAGYGLYMLKGRPVFTYNLLELLTARWANDGDPAARGGQAHDRVRLQVGRPRHRQGRHRRAEGGRERDPHTADSENDPVPDTARRGFRHWGRHAHGGERPGLSDAVPFQRQDRPADLWGRNNWPPRTRRNCKKGSPKPTIRDG